MIKTCEEVISKINGFENVATQIEVDQMGDFENPLTISRHLAI